MASRFGLSSEIDRLYGHDATRDISTDVTAA
jgi:hypothetical protein